LFILKALTYADWVSLWDQKTSGKEESFKSPVIYEEIVKASSDGLIPTTAELDAKHISIGNTLIIFSILMSLVNLTVLSVPFLDP